MTAESKPHTVERRRRIVPRIIREHKIISAGVAGFTAGMLAIGGLTANSRQGTIDYDTPTIRITQINSEDLGLYVQVLSEAQGAAHFRARVSPHVELGPFNLGFTKTVNTNTTERTVQGEAHLAVDNAFTTTQRTDMDWGKGKKHVHQTYIDVTIGKVYTMGWINFTGLDGDKYNPAIGARIGTFGFPDNSTESAGLEFLLQESIKRSACFEPAVDVFKKDVQNHYDTVYHAVDKSIVTRVHYTPTAFSTIPVATPFPSGKNVNAALEKTGLYNVPEDVDFDLKDTTCSSYLVDGKVPDKTSTTSPSLNNNNRVMGPVAGRRDENTTVTPPTVPSGSQLEPNYPNKTK